MVPEKDHGVPDKRLTYKTTVEVESNKFLIE